MALPSHCYQDPVTHIKFESEKNKCQGCVKELGTMIANKLVRYCSLGEKHGHGCKSKLAR